MRFNMGFGLIPDTNRSRKISFRVVNAQLTESRLSLVKRDISSEYIYMRAVELI